MAMIISRDELIAMIPQIDVIAAMKEGFIAYSNGKTVVPPVGELLFEAPKGEAHIKYGYVKNDDFYVIKIASGFYGNPQLGISSSQGMVLVFSQKTGQAVAVLMDDGYLTDIRTAAAGALVAKYFAPKKIESIGIIGTGIQAELQLHYLKQVTSCRSVWLWGRKLEKAQQFKQKFKHDFNFNIAKTPSEVAFHSRLIVTTTPSEIPLIMATDVQRGTHITAVGADTENKQELDSALLQRADLVVVDSLPQSKNRGEVYKAIQDGMLSEQKAIELGKALQEASLQRTNAQQISIVDLTGVAVQDIMLAKAIFLNYKNE